ncbi:MAG: hypothetical protein L0Z53_10845 [Acidobacteriales bacterium]|nr:hypothetical protein [Terriglobales bacterium]
MTAIYGAYRFHDGERYVVAIGHEGRTRLHLAVITDGGVTALDVPRGELRYCEPLTLKGSAYPVARAARRMLAVGRRNGITRGARDILRQAIGEA